MGELIRNFYRSLLPKVSGLLLFATVPERKTSQGKPRALSAGMNGILLGVFPALDGMGRGT